MPGNFTYGGLPSPQGGATSSAAHIRFAHLQELCAFWGAFVPRALVLRARSDLYARRAVRLRDGILFLLSHELVSDILQRCSSYTWFTCNYSKVIWFSCGPRSLHF
eukprot:8196083-Pyramimonas_sp.AAC.1